MHPLADLYINLLSCGKCLSLIISPSILNEAALLINEPIFLGHFPSQPVFPGVLIVEALAQAAGILAFRSRNRTLEDGYIYYLAGTDKTKFKRSVLPGDQIYLEVEISNLRNHWMKAFGKAFVDQKLVCSTFLTCAEQKVK